jgi:uncharacterized repeat protein (TIGR03803 family)
MRRGEPMRLILEAVRRSNCGKKAFAVFVFCATTAITMPAQTFTTLVNFSGTNGSGPAAPLGQGPDGNLYGTTAGGGAHNGGTFFKMTPAGNLTTLYNFCSQTSCTDGSGPNTELAQTITGKFYATTAGGGANGWGTVFEITPAGNLTTIYSFCSQANCADGSDPLGVVLGANGDLYGVTQGGGTGDLGTIFEVTPTGKLTTLYSFSASEGFLPLAGLVQATNGNFYGTASHGGSEGDGTVFEITPAGNLTTLISFDGSDGEGPSAALVQAANGSFYGTTDLGGGSNDDGTVFEISPTGKLKRLYSFCSQTKCADGANPGALSGATDGNFYGTTFLGGTDGFGTLFEITPAGGLTTLHSFAGTDGEEPSAALTQSTTGTFYGTTARGGGNEDGTAFSLSVGLGPFVETLPSLGKLGASVVILGNNLTGSTSVTFNETSATFKVVSSSEIATTVPTGATTGTVKVVTPGGTLSSNVPFTVR